MKMSSCRAALERSSVTQHRVLRSSCCLSSLRHQGPLPGPFLDVKAKLPGELLRLRRGYHEGKTSPANHDERTHQPVHQPHPYRPGERLQVVVDAHLVYEVVPRHAHGQKPEQAHLKPNIGQVVGDHVAHPELVEKQECRKGEDELVAQARYLQRRPLSTIPYSPSLVEGVFCELRLHPILGTSALGGSRDFDPGAHERPCEGLSRLGAFSTPPPASGRPSPLGAPADGASCPPPRTPPSRCPCPPLAGTVPPPRGMTRSM